MHRLSLFIITAFAAAILAGCTPEGRQEYGQAGEQAGEAAQQTGEAVRTDAQETADRADRWSIEDIDMDPDRFGMAMRNAGMTARVRSTLMAAQNLEFEDLNVDTVGTTITLKGRVDTQQGKQRANQLAKALAGPNWTVQDQLQVGLESNNRLNDANRNNANMDSDAN